MKYYPVKALAVAALLIGSTAFMSPSYAAAPEPSVIHVTGYAQQEVAPDTAYVTIGMETTGEDAQQARTQNNEVMSQVTAAMKSMGIAPENLKTMGFYMSPNYDSKSRKIVSYTVTNNLQIKVSDLDMIPRIIAKAANLNANSIQGIRFTNEKTEQIKDNLVKQAIINGRRQAEAAAQAAGMSLGKVKEISISGRSPSYENGYAGAALRMSAKAADYAPVEAGTNTLSETVTMTLLSPIAYGRAKKIARHIIVSSYFSFIHGTTKSKILPGSDDLTLRNEASGTAPALVHPAVFYLLRRLTRRHGRR